MAKIQCTRAEISNVLDVDDDTLVSRIKERYKVDCFSAWFAKYSSEGKISLRRWQFREAEKGNAKMLIRLGDIYLDQDKRNPSESNTNITFIGVDKPNEVN